MLEFGVLNQDLVDEWLTVDGGLSLLDYLHVLTNEDIDLIIGKICKHVSDCLLDLQKTACVIQGILEVLREITKNFPISDENCLSLSKPLLLLVVECCNVATAKTAIYVLNRLFEHQQVVQIVLEDESMKSDFKHLGIKVFEFGDYDCQMAILEVMLRISVPETRKEWAEKWFSSGSMQAMFLSIQLDHFEIESRRFLNFLNRSELGQKVHSVMACSVIFDGRQLKAPYESDFWIDFNYTSRSISFYCSELENDNDSNNTQGLWETVTINSDVVSSCFLNVNIVKDRKELAIYLKCPSYVLLSQPSESSANSLKGNLIKISFQECIDVHPHIQFVYGSLYNGVEDLQNHEDNMHHSQKRRKTSNATVHGSKNGMEVRCNENGSQENSTFHNRNRKISEATVGGYDEIENNFSRMSASQNGNRKISKATVFSFENSNGNYSRNNECVFAQGVSTRFLSRSRKTSEAFVCNEEYGDTDDISNRHDQEIPTSQHKNRKTSGASTFPYVGNCNNDDNNISTIDDSFVLDTFTSQHRSRKSSKATIHNLENENENYSSCDPVVGASQAKKRKPVDVEKDNELDVNNEVNFDYQSSSQPKRKSLNSGIMKTSDNVINCKESNLGDERNIHSQNIDLIEIGKKTPVVIFFDIKRKENRSSCAENNLEMASSQIKNRKISKAAVYNIREGSSSVRSKNKNPLVQEIAEFEAESEPKKSEEMYRKFAINKINERRPKTVLKKCTLRGNLFELVKALDNEKDASHVDRIQNENESSERKTEESGNKLECRQLHDEVSPFNRKNPARRSKSNTRETNLKRNNRKRMANNKINYDNKVEVAGEISLSQIEKETNKETVIKNGNLEQIISTDEVSPSQIESKSVKKRIKMNFLQLDSTINEISPTQTEKLGHVRVSDNYNPIGSIAIKDKTTNLSEKDQGIMSNSVILHENQVIINSKTASQEVNHDEQIVNQISNYSNNSLNRSKNSSIKSLRSSQDILDNSTKRTVASEFDSKILDGHSKHNLEFCVENITGKKSPLVTTASLSSDIDQNIIDSSNHSWHESEIEELNEIFRDEAGNKSCTNSIPDLDDLVNQITTKSVNAKVSKNNTAFELSNLRNQITTGKNNTKQNMSKKSNDFLETKKKISTSKSLNQSVMEHQTNNKLLIKSNELERLSDSADSETKKRATSGSQTSNLLNKSNQLEKESCSNDSSTRKATDEPQLYHKLPSESNQFERDSGLADSDTKKIVTNERQTYDKLLSKPNQSENDSDSADSVTKKKVTDEPQTYDELLSISNQSENGSDASDSTTKKKALNEPQKYKLLGKSKLLESDSGLQKKASYRRAQTHRSPLKSNHSEDSSSTNFDTRKKTINEAPQAFDEGLTESNQIEKHSGLADSSKRSKTQKSRKIRLYNPDRAPLYPIDLKVLNEKKQFSKDELFSVVIPPGDGEEWEEIQHNPQSTSKLQRHQTKLNSASLQSNKSSQATRKVHLDVDQKDEDDFQTPKKAKMIAKSYNDSGISMEKSSLCHTVFPSRKRFFPSNSLPDRLRKQNVMNTLSKQRIYRNTSLSNTDGMHQDSFGTSKSQKRKSDNKEEKSTRKAEGTQMQSRKAAVKATEKNKVLATNNALDYDCYDDFESDGSLYRPPQKQSKSRIYEPVKERKRRPKNFKKFKANTTASTVSSDVSWFHKKTNGQFETPKKKYTTWKKEKAARIMKPLPIQVSNVKLKEKRKILENEVIKKKQVTKRQSKISNKNHKGIEEASKYSDSETRKKRTEWSDLDCYSLTKEKQTNSYRTLNYNKVLQAFDEEVKRSVSGSYSKHTEKGAVEDSNIRHSTAIYTDVSALEFMPEEEFSEKDIEHDSFDMNMQPELHYHSDSFRNAEKASIENSSEVKATGNLKLKKSRNTKMGSDSSTTVTNDLEENRSMNEIIENENQDRTDFTDEDNVTSEPIFDSGIENTELFKEISPEDYNLLQDEANGKQLHLERYLKEEATFSDKSKKTTYPNDDNISLSVENESLNAKPGKRNRTKDEDYEEENLVKKQRISESIPMHAIDSNEEGSEESKLKYCLFSKTQCEKTSSFMNEIRKDSEQDASERLSLHSEILKIKKICKSNVLTKNPVLRKEIHVNGKPSLFKMFSNEVKKLTKQLVGTLQKYVNDFGEKLTSHREDMVKATEILSQQDVSIIDEQDLIRYQKDCKNRRLHLQKSLRKLQELSNNYFEVEAQCNKKLKYIQKKATKKFTHRVQMAKYNTIKMMETQSLLELKKFLSKFQLDVG